MPLEANVQALKFLLDQQLHVLMLQQAEIVLRQWDIRLMMPVNLILVMFQEIVQLVLI